jgi:hypothetical protein
MQAIEPVLTGERRRRHSHSGRPSQESSLSILTGEPRTGKQRVEIGLVILRRRMLPVALDMQCETGLQALLEQAAIAPGVATMRPNSKSFIGILNSSVIVVSPSFFDEKPGPAALTEPGLEGHSPNQTRNSGRRPVPVHRCSKLRYDLGPSVSGV